jgi:hypothetical protein
LTDLIDSGIDPERNKERKDIYLKQFIGFTHPKALTSQSKLSLNDTDKDIYDSYLVQLKKPLNLSRLSESNRLMIKAFEYFTEKIGEISIKDSGEAFADFIESVISSKLFFTNLLLDNSIKSLKISLLRLLIYRKLHRYVR